MADFLEYYHLRLRTLLLDDTFSWHEFRVYLNQLPVKSRVVTVLNPQANGDVNTLDDDDEEAILGYFSNAFK